MDARIYDEWENEWLDPKPLLENWLGVKFSDLKEISKEEFYNVELPMRIDFAYVPSPYNGNTVGIVNFEYDEGMTWREWVNSDYNTLEEVGFPVSVYEDGNNISGGYKSAMAWWVCTPDGVSVRTDDIIEGKLYQMLYAG